MRQAKDIRVLVACEESQAVCKAFRERGFQAFSCDLQECSGDHPEWHIVGDAIKEAYSGKYDAMIGFPPCTYLSYAGIAHWNNPGRLEKRLKALDFFAQLWDAPIPFIALENPKGCASPTIAKYSQEIQPYYFGDDSLKTTWIWLKGLPRLNWSKAHNLFDIPVSIGKPIPSTVHLRRPGKHCKGGEIKKRYFTDALPGGLNSGYKRSKTFPGIAQAMAQQWGDFILNN